MEEKRIVYRVFVGKPEGNRHIGRPRSRFAVNNKMLEKEDEEV
jgi:hypothetical protein